MPTKRKETGASGPSIFGPDIGFSLYIHWPYCRQICPYCDFNVQKGKGDADNALLSYLLKDLQRWQALLPNRKLDSLYFGGGTPSLLGAQGIETLIETAHQKWPVTEQTEITVEANPSDFHCFSDFLRAGVSRLSLGVQSFQDPVLRFLGRNHDANTALRASGHAAELFKAVNLDLIYAFQGQDLKSWQQELDLAVSFNPTNLSLYQLTIETQTSFGRRQSRGERLTLDEEQAAKSYEQTQQLCENLGYPGYEISNHARSSQYQSRHNSLGWLGADYVGVGPGAHGRVTIENNRYATYAPKKLTDYQLYTSRIKPDLSGESNIIEKLSTVQVAQELFASQLRLTCGVFLPGLQKLGLNLDQEKLGQFEISGLVQYREDHLKILPQGKLLTDYLIAQLLSE